MRTRSWGAPSLGFLLVLGLLALSPTVEAHPLHLQIANMVLDTPQPVDVNNWEAQSFLPNSSFWISRVSLFASDVGASDSLTVSIRGNVGSFPGGSDLTQGAVDGPSGGTWIDVDLSPFVQLAAGQPHWIVAHSTAPGGAGYTWWDSGNNGAYLNGTGVTSSDGISWALRSRDFSFRVYGFLQPSFAFAVGASNSTLVPGQTTVFRVNFTNGGPGSAAALWVNVSLPAELSYISDNAAAIGGARSGTYSFAFTNVAPVVRLFNITARANGGVADGTTAVAGFVFDATDHNGAPLARSTRNVPVTIRNARLALSVAASASFADPGDSIVLDATVTNVGQEPAVQLRIEAPVNSDGTYVSSFPAATYFPVNRTLLWTVASLGPGGNVSVRWTITVNPGTLDQTAIVSSILASYKDSSASPLPPELASALTRVQAPSFVPALRLDRTSAEHADEVRATLYFNNTGSVAAPEAWANWSLGGHYGLIALIPALPSSSIANGFSISWTNLSPGVHSVVARLRVDWGLADGLSMGIQVQWTATDGNRNLLPASVLPAAATLDAPSIQLTLQRGNARVETGSLLTLDLTIRNLGAAPAVGWLNLTLPAGIAYLSDNGTFVENTTAGRVSWTLPVLPARSSLALGVVLRMSGKPGVVSFRFSMNFTDGKGSPTATALSNSVSVELVAAGTILDFWPWWIVALVGGTAAVGAVVWRRRASNTTVEDVFVAGYDGVLLAHRSTTLIPDQDEDVAVAMFTVIQHFVRDTFSRGTDENMRALEFGERKILIERGENHYLAVVYRGSDNGRLADQMHKVSKQIEEKFGQVLAHWEGDTDTVHGITFLLPQVWAQHRGSLRIRPAS